MRAHFAFGQTDAATSNTSFFCEGPRDNDLRTSSILRTRVPMTSLPHTNAHIENTAHILPLYCGTDIHLVPLRRQILVQA